MSLYQGCPGAIRFRKAVPEYIDCPDCGEEMEVWSDELVARCHHCHALVRRDRRPSCIEWCQSAEECIGVETYKRLRFPSPFEGNRADEKGQKKA